VRERLGGWLVVAVLAAGCAAPARPAEAPAGNQTDVWFMQHMVPHLWQASSIASVTRERLSHPALARLADTIARRGAADSQQLQEWLYRQGLAPHGHSHQPVGNRKRSDLERLSRLPRGTALDLAFIAVMSARERAGMRLAAAEARGGGLAEVRQLAGRMLAEQRVRLRQMDAWRRAWSRAAAGRG
jgi:uncharacterized protein (DUF305 family)